MKTSGCSVAVGGSRLLHITVLAEIDGVEDIYVLSFGRSNKSVLGFATARANAPGGKVADAKRLVGWSRLLPTRGRK